MNYGLDNFQYQNVWQEISLPKLPVKNAAPKNGNLYAATDIELEIDGEEEISILLGRQEKVEISLALLPELEAPFEAGSQAGKVVYRLNGEIFASYPVVTVEGAEKLDFQWYLKWVEGVFLP